MNLTVRILFLNERRLCDRIFPSSYAADISFSKVCKELTVGLLRFANTLATENHHSPYHLSHAIPKVFKTLSDLIPNFNALFYGRLLSESLGNVVLVGKRLGIFVELESLIQREVAQKTVPNGGIHPTTHEVMNYLRDVFTDNENFRIRKGISSFSDQVARVIQVLVSNLEAKSTNYKDPALGHVFMINNLMLLQYDEHIYGVILGQDWYKSKINQRIELYQRSSWNKILEFLMLDSCESMTQNVAGLMKNKLKCFNQHFNEISRAQAAWFIFDEKLREMMIKSIENTLLPAYGNFLGKLQDILALLRHSTPENEDLGFLFTRVDSASQEGNSGSDNSIMARLMGSFGCIELLKKKNINVIHTISKLLNLPSHPFMIKVGIRSSSFTCLYSNSRN
ncbi:hypothetical protein Fmac_031301 [Flemingia macrophylla]|uniref:Exocyst subunit Exo70 family protein n=1 Tax=Flemingia macrophylla TaxID=520843 RepID=A0ABD1L1P3_9FABA